MEGEFIMEGKVDLLALFEQRSESKLKKKKYVFAAQSKEEH